MARWSSPLLTLLVLVACTANLPDGRFRCTATGGGCPNGLACGSDGLCYHAGHGPDGGGMGVDADLPDTGPEIDAGPCTATDCVTVTVTNAYGPVGVGGMSLSVEGRSRTFPAFGGTTNAFQVSLGGDASLDIITVAGTLHFPATGGGVYAFVVGHDPDPQQLAPVTRLLSASAASTTTGQFNIYPIDLAQSASGLFVADPMTPTTDRPLSPGASGDAGVLFMPQGQRFPLTVSIDPGAAASRLMLAAFDATELPQTGNYFVALVGRTDRHLAADDGLRLIAIVPGMHLIQSQPVVWILNTLPGTVAVCDQGGHFLFSVLTEHLSNPIPGFDAATSAGAGRTVRFGDGRGHTDCSLRPTSVIVPFPADPMHPHTTGRAVLTVGGNLDVMFGGGAGIEGPPMVTSSEQLVTYANGLFTSNMDFGSTAHPMRGSASAISTVTIDWPVRPSDLLVGFTNTSGMQTRTFDWVPTDFLGIAFVTGSDTGFTAYEMNANFGTPLDLHVVRQH